MPLELPVTTAIFCWAIGCRRIPQIAAQCANTAFQGRAIAELSAIREDRRLSQPHRFVSGHGFSRAVSDASCNPGFSPCVELTGLKAHPTLLSCGSTKVVP